MTINAELRTYADAVLETLKAAQPQAGWADLTQEDAWGVTFGDSEGRRLYLSGDSRHDRYDAALGYCPEYLMRVEAHWTLSAELWDHRSYGRTTPKAGATVRKGLGEDPAAPAALAKSLTRRIIGLLPEYDEEFNAAKGRKQAAEDYATKQTNVRKALVKAGLSENSWNGSLHLTNFNSPVYGTAEAGSDSVDLDLRRVPVETAVAIIELLKKGA